MGEHTEFNAAANLYLHLHYMYMHLKCTHIKQVTELNDVKKG